MYYYVIDELSFSRIEFDTDIRSIFLIFFHYNKIVLSILGFSLTLIFVYEILIRVFKLLNDRRKKLINVSKNLKALDKTLSKFRNLNHLIF